MAVAGAMAAGSTAEHGMPLREGALPRTLPTGHKFVPKGGDAMIMAVARMIGNAAPVRPALAVWACVAGYMVDRVE